MAVRNAQHAILERWSANHLDSDSEVGDRNAEGADDSASDEWDETFNCNINSAGSGLSAWDRLGEDYERDANIGASL